MTYKFEMFLVIQKKKRLINIKSFKLPLPLILYIEYIFGKDLCPVKIFTGHGRI